MMLSVKSISYILGIFSTIQILSLANVTVFNYLLLFFVIVFFVRLKLNVKLDCFFLVSIVLSLTTIVLSVSSDLLTCSFIKNAFNSGIIYLVCLLVYLVFKSNLKSSFSFYKGFKVSCYLTLFWCFLQIICFYLFSFNLNVVVFYDLLKIPYSQFSEDSFHPTGFYLHRAILLPIFLFLFFSSKNLFVIVSVSIIAVLSKSTTLIILLFLSFILLYLSQIINLRRLYSPKFISYTLIFIFAFILILLSTNYVQDVVFYVFERITDSTSNKADNSSVVHFLYYYNFPVIFYDIGFIYELLGSGFGTSGFFYTLFNGQYRDMSYWIVESDYINIIINQGLIGAVVFYSFLIRLCIIAYQKSFKRTFFFLLITLLAGIFYNLQFNWFILVEFSLYFLMINNIDPFNLKKY